MTPPYRGGWHCQTALKYGHYQRVKLDTKLFSQFVKICVKSAGYKFRPTLTCSFLLADR